MAGNLSGGKKAAATNRAKYGDDFYKINGAKGGAKSTRIFTDYDIKRNRLIAALGGMQNFKREGMSEEAKLARMEKKQDILRQIAELDNQEKK